MSETKINAACCRAMTIPRFHNLRDLIDEISRFHLKPALSSGCCGALGADRIRTAQILVELPKSWDDWPEDAKMSIPRASWEQSREAHFLNEGVEGPLFATCKFVDRDTGACMIYDKRPAMCQEYATMPNSVNPGGGCQFTNCASHVDGQCCPKF